LQNKSLQKKKIIIIIKSFFYSKIY